MTIDSVKFASSYEIINEVMQMISEQKHTIAKVLYYVLQERVSLLEQEILLLKEKACNKYVSSAIYAKNREVSDIKNFTENVKAKIRI